MSDETTAEQGVQVLIDAATENLERTVPEVGREIGVEYERRVKRLEGVKRGAPEYVRRSTDLNFWLIAALLDIHVQLVRTLMQRVAVTEAQQARPGLIIPGNGGG